MEKDSIGSRMKANYEDRYRFSLTRRTPVIMRLDGKAFHTLTRGLSKPFDAMFSDTMIATAEFLCSEIQGAKCAYVQSDEISILITDFDILTTDAWFDYNIQKMTSVSAGIASAYFTNRWFDRDDTDNDIAIFDSRVFNVPKEEVCNYFIWRQLDWMRNSVQMLAQAHFSHKQLHGKNQPAMHEMLHDVGINWADLQERWKNGTFIIKLAQGWESYSGVILKEHRTFIEDYLVDQK